jgi:uncharacterized protein (UPF0261 family)
MHDAEGLAALVDDAAARRRANTRVQMLDTHINDTAFADAALAVLRRWVARRAGCRRE